MKIIGLTGGISSGKSTAARFLAELGAVVIDTDKVGHEIYKPGTEAWQEVVASFGRQVLTASGEIDRKKLGEVVFGDAEALSKLNRITHPRIAEVVKTKLEEYRRQGIKAVVIEVPLLIEAGWASMVDEVWVTVASEATVLERLRKAGLTEEQAQARIRSQPPPEERLNHADVVINNDGSLEELRDRVREMWERGE